ncbi:MAG: hypothetical protein WC789_05885 [Lentisphaeria bacterium]|jgi:RNA recognition motif-containing protein
MEIFVSNLAYQVQDSELRDLFAEFGEVRRAAVVKDRETGRSRGFGFVEMPDAAAGQRAVAELNGKMFQSRPLAASEARPREPGGSAPRPPRPEGGYAPRPPRPEGGYAPRPEGGYAPRPPRPEGGFAPRPAQPEPGFGEPPAEGDTKEQRRAARSGNFGKDKRKAAPFEEPKRRGAKLPEKGRRGNLDEDDDEFTPPVRIH